MTQHNSRSAAHAPPGAGDILGTSLRPDQPTNAPSDEHEQNRYDPPAGPGPVPAGHPPYPSDFESLRKDAVKFIKQFGSAQTTCRALQALSHDRLAMFAIAAGGVEQAIDIVKAADSGVMP